MSAQDLELRSNIRNALTRQWIDLTKTNFLVRRGHVQLNGEPSVIGAPGQHQGTSAALKAFEADVRRLKDVKSVSFEFTNWVRADSGEWSCTSNRGCADPSPAAVDDEPRASEDPY